MVLVRTRTISGGPPAEAICQAKESWVSRSIFLYKSSLFVLNSTQMSEKKTILFTNNATGHSQFLVIDESSGEVFELNTEEAPEEISGKIKALMSVNHHIVRESENTDKFEKCVADMQKLIIGE